ncbi:lipase [Microcoleus sp. A2-C5]|uniref:lipase n=1 Tax=unclassified Microcoleus TaxID=2642155 RepID=UPI002FD3D603
MTAEQIQKRDLFLERIKADLLPDITSRKRLYVLLIDSMAVKGISELDIFEKISISEKLLSKIRNLDMEFQFGRSYLEQLAPYLFQVEDWEELRPVFKVPYISYQGWVDNLIEDLQYNRSICRYTSSLRNL